MPLVASRAAITVSLVITLAAVVTVLAVARLTRLVTSDYLLAGPRARLIRRLGTESKLSYLLTCPWCMSMWVAAPVVLTAYWHGTSPWYLIPAGALAASHVTGLLARLERD